MQLKFYKNKDDPRTLHKNLGAAIVTVTNAVVYEDCSVFNPSFLLNFNSDILKCNYLEADSNFNNRKYFIDDITVVTGGKCIVNCTVDVLMTYQSEIEAMSCNVVRQENKRNKWLQDSKMQKTAETYTCNLLFDKNPFQTLGDLSPFGYRVHYVLSVVGGNGS